MWGHPGIGRYIRELSREIVSLAPEFRFSFLGESERIKDFFRSSNLLNEPVYTPASSKVYSLAEQWEILKKASNLDLLHSPHFNIPVFYRKKMVVTVHDLIYLHEPTASRFKFGKIYVNELLKQIAKKASLVITVSEYTKKDLLEHFPRFSAERIVAIPEAPSAIFAKMPDHLLQDAKKRFGLSKPFILFVGTLKPHKNIPTLINAVKILRDSKGIEHDLVLVGRKDQRNKEVLEMIHDNVFVKYLGEPSDKDLVSIYNLADVFVLPSFYEGFGLPALEAMACGTPVIVSNRCSLPEIVGSAGAIFDAGQVDALVGVLYNILFSQELRKNMSNIGLEQAGRFSWRKTAEETVKIYERAMS